MPDPLIDCAIGLSQAQAEAVLASEGPNELPSEGRQSLLSIVADVLREPMLLLLLAAGAVYLLLGDVHDALILIAFAGLTIIIAIIQESRSARAIDALRELGSPLATVIRDGRRVRLPSREVVPGDLMVISEGGRIAADGWVIEGDGIQADEAILTGESVAVSKQAEQGELPTEPPKPGGDGLSYAFSGTMIVRGTGLVRVTMTGSRSAIGRIGQSLAALETETPRLTLQTRYLVRWFAALGLGVSVLAVLLYGLLRGGWLEALLSGIALAMSMLPEELPVVLTLFMTMGALRMARIHVLARRGTAIETLGAATVLCTDKTGTLTQNRMTIAQLRLPAGDACKTSDDATELPEPFAELAALGLLACLEQPFDPMEEAFHEFARRRPETPLRRMQEDGWTLLRQYPLTPDLLAMSNAWQRDSAGEQVIAAKGAPEAIADLCGMGPAERRAMHDLVAEMATVGMRVLGIAEARWAGVGLPESQNRFDFVFRGLVGLADPIRETVPGAVLQLRQAGVRVVMMTGDYPATASAIAVQAGIDGKSVMSGADLAELDDAELATRIGGISVFARIMPEQKLRIVRALKEAGEIVAMIGDGVNDAPSLKAAHIGIAMGKRGTDVAREASSIVLLDDDFGSVVAAVRLGRRIYDNLRKATGFIFAVHLPIGGLALMPLLIGWPLILGPVNIALLEMIVDPVCSLAFEAEKEESDIMRRPPRRTDSPLVSRSLLAWSGVQGGLAFVLLVGLAGWANLALPDEAGARTATFAGLVAAVVVLVFANRSFKGSLIGSSVGANLPLAVIMAFVAGTFALVFLAAPIADLFHFAVLDTSGIIAVGLVTALLVLLLTAIKSQLAGALKR